MFFVDSKMDLDEFASTNNTIQTFLTHLDVKFNVKVLSFFITNRDQKEWVKYFWPDSVNFPAPEVYNRKWKVI